MIHGFFIFAAVFLVYVNTLQNGFVNDDHALIQFNPSIRSDTPIRNVFLGNILSHAEEQSTFYRPIQILSYRVDHFLWGNKPAGYHLANIIYHALAALLFYYFLTRFFNSDLPVLWICLIWAVHPIQVKVVSYASSRADILLFIFILLALIGFLNRWKVLWMMPLVLGALLSKETAIFLPVFLVFCGWSLDAEAPYTRASFAQAIKRCLPYFALVAGYLICRVFLLDIPMGFPSSEAQPLSFFPRLMAGVRSLWILLGIYLLPVDLRFVRHLDHSNSWAQLLSGFAGLALLFLLCWMAWIMRKHRPILLFCVLWVVLQYAPYFNALPINWDISEHWMYIVSTGFVVAIFSLIGTWIKKYKRSARLLMLAIVIALSVMTFLRNTQWKDDISLFRPEVEANPRSRWAHYNLAFGYSQKGMIDDALKHYHEALRLGPVRAKDFWVIGRLLVAKQSFESAAQYYQLAVMFDPKNAAYRASLAESYIGLQKFDEAELEYLKAIEYQPRNVTYLNSLGILYAYREKFGLAADIFGRVISVDPFNESARRNLRILKRAYDLVSRVERESG